MIYKHDPTPHLEDILNSITWIEHYSSGLTLDQILANQMVQDAIVRRIEIRNKLIHDYGHVDIELVWAVVENDLPNLKTNIKEILDS